MNVNMDVNNILNMVQSNLNTAKGSSTGNEKFLAMLNSMMTENNLNDLYGSMGSGNTTINNGLMELLTGNGTDYLNMSEMNNADINQVITDAGIFPSDSEKDTDNIIASSYMMQNYFNLIAPQLMGMSENADTDSHATSGLNNLQALNQSMNENGVLKNGTLENSDMKQPGMDAGQIKNEKAVLSPQAEKLISEIEAKRSKLRGSINSNAEMLNFVSNKTPAPESNTIIQLSDESTQIRSQVVEQVKENIVMLTDVSKADGSTSQQVIMELYPRELGKVDIKMTMIDNKMTVEIKALNEETQKILASGADDLLKSLNKTAESISIVFKSVNSSQEQVVNYYDKENQYGELNHDDQNLDQDNKRRNEYFYEEDSKKSNDDTFSELINSRSTIVNQ